MTAKELWEKINKEDAEMLCYLWERWQDEKEYEDINDYLAYAKKSIPEAFEIHKRPFSIVCNCEDGLLRVIVKRKGNYLALSGEITMRR